MRLVPAIDLLGGRCVRLLNGDFAAVTHYAGEPVALAQGYHRSGARWLHVVDLDGARLGQPVQLATVGALCRIPGLAIQLGGGMRTEADLAAALASGVTRVVVGSAAVEAPQEVARWIARFGAARICVALDVRFDEDDQPSIRTRGWTRRGGGSLWSVLEGLLATGLRHVICTDIGRDGALTGPNLELYRTAVSRYPLIDWQASGGVRDASDLEALATAGVSAAISGRALLDGRMKLEELQSFLPAD